MEMTTVLRAMEFAHSQGWQEKRNRQYWRFRKWMICHDEGLKREVRNKQIEIDVLTERLSECEWMIDDNNT